MLDRQQRRLATWSTAVSGAGCETAPSRSAISRRATGLLIFGRSSAACQPLNHQCPDPRERGADPRIRPARKYGAAYYGFARGIRPRVLFDPGLRCSRSPYRICASRHHRSSAGPLLPWYLSCAGLDAFLIDLRRRPADPVIQRWLDSTLVMHNVSWAYKDPDPASKRSPSAPSSTASSSWRTPHRPARPQCTRNGGPTRGALTPPGPHPS